MAFIKWSPDYEFGIPEMDEQHKHFADLLNRFYEGLVDQDTKDHLLILLNEAIDYTHYHFSEEVKMMQDIGYSALIEQKKMHSDIENRIEKFKQTILLNKPVLSMEVINEIKSWFTYHIQIEDKKYVELYKRVKSKK
ncbi:MAG: bacteriohemerythrin [Treponema sp.]|nr:bacteriohemerythrin [Treponema sp.]